MKFKTFGNKKNIPFVILHGWGGSSKSWENIALNLSKDFFVIVPDFPCASKLAECDKVYNLNDYVQLLNQLIESLNVDKFYLLGHSNGGAIASKFAVKYPQKIIKLFLNNSAGIRKDDKISFKRKVFGFLTKLLKPVKKIPGLNKLRIIFYKIIGGHDYLEAEKNPNKKQTFLNMINEDLQSIFPKIKISTILIRGEKDTYTPLYQGKKINQLLTNSKLIIIPNVRHGIHLQNPKKLLEAIKKNL